MAQTPSGDESPADAGAQTPAGTIKPVAVMPFVGDDLALSERLQSAVIGEVEKMEGFSTEPISPTEFPETLEFRPDEPPDPVYSGTMPYVLTGEYYFDTEDLEHFQLWLWNSNDGSLIYTDELVAEGVDEAEGYLPALVSWVFSKIPFVVVREEILNVEKPGEELMAEGDRAGEKGPSFPRLYLGLWGGASFSAYNARTTESFDAGMSQGFGGAAAFLAGYRPWRFFSLQAEAIFSLDAFKVFIAQESGSEILHTTTQYTSLSLLLPLLIRFPFEAGKYHISLALGPYYIFPMSQIVDEGSAYPYQMDLPLGIMGGIDLGYAFGPGELFGSLRYGRDLGLTIVRSGLQYAQARVMVFLGYRFGFFN
jgi:hypothetical protein